MLKRLLQSLGIGEKPKQHRRPAGRPTTGDGQRRCRNCAVRLPPSAFRCSACGARVLQPQPGAEPTPVSEPAPVTEPALRLGDIERRILVSANADRSSRIVTLQPSRGAPGEVKAGNSRFEGDAALTAVSTLLRQGYIAEWGDGTFTVTPEGETEADKLS